MSRTKPPEASVCPQCSGLGQIAVTSVYGRRVLVACGGAVCQRLLEERVTQHVTTAVKAWYSRRDDRDIADRITGSPETLRRIVAETMRHLPPDLIRSAKR